MHHTDRVRAAAEALVSPEEGLIAIGRAVISAAGMANPVAVAITSERLRWGVVWESERQGSLQLDDVTHFRERDDGKDVRMSLRDGSEIRLRFGGPTANALVALRRELMTRQVPIQLFSRDPDERAQTKAASRAELRPAGRLRAWWRNFRFRHRLRRS